MSDFTEKVRKMPPGEKYRKAQTLLREAVERIEALEKIAILARQYVKAIRLDERAELCVALSALDTKDQL